MEGAHLVLLCCWGQIILATRAAVERIRRWKSARENRMQVEVEGEEQLLSGELR